MSIEIEICTNDEWLDVFGGVCVRDAGGCIDRDLGNEYRAHLEREIADRCEWANTVAAKGQRVLLHGWNGAHFTHRGTGWGTFDSLTPEQLRTVEDADEAAQKAYECDCQERDRCHVCGKVVPGCAGECGCDSD